MTLARRLATGDTYAVFVTSRMRTETRASSASVYVSSVIQSIGKRGNGRRTTDTGQTMEKTDDGKTDKR